MNDNIYNILIKFGLSNEKATEAVKELNKLEEAGKRAGTETAKAADTANVSLKDTKKAVDLLSAQLGPLGQVMRYIFNPAILGAAVLAKAVGEVWKSFWQFQAGIVQSGINAAKSIGDIKGAMLALDIERAKADANFKSSLADFERQSKRKIEVINLEKDAVLQLLDAREKVDLAGAKNPEEEKTIRERYANLRGRTTSQTTEKEFAAREASLNQMEAMGRQRYREGYALTGMTPDKVKLNLAKLPAELKSLDEQIAESEKSVADMSSITTVAGAFPYWNDPENYKTQLGAYTSEKAKLEKLKQTKKWLEDRQTPLTQAATAYASGEDLLGQVRTGREDLANRKTDTAFRNQTNWRADGIAAGMGPAADITALASSGADTLKAGGKISGEQAAAIAKATQILGLVGQSNQTILTVLSRFNDTQENFKRSLDEINRRVNNSNLRP